MTCTNLNLGLEKPCIMSSPCPKCNKIIIIQHVSGVTLHFHSKFDLIL